MNWFFSENLRLRCLNILLILFQKGSWYVYFYFILFRGNIAFIFILLIVFISNKRRVRRLIWIYLWSNIFTLDNFWIWKISIVFYEVFHRGSIFLFWNNFNSWLFTVAPKLHIFFLTISERLVNFFLGTMAELHSTLTFYNFATILGWIGSSWWFFRKDHYILGISMQNICL